MKFKNEYILTKEITKEYVYNILFKKMFYSGFVVFLLAFIMFLLINNEFRYVFFTLGLIILITILITPNIMINEIMKNARILNNGNIEKTCITFGNNIIMEEGNVRLEFLYKSIKDVICTKNLIVLRLNESSSIIVLKNGFTLGNESEFIGYMRGIK